MRNVNYFNDLGYETEYVSRSSNPKFKSFVIPTTILCCANYDMPIKFELFDHSVIGLHTYYKYDFSSYCGEVVLTLD